uniref:Uncharacterized protein n=1 Tax=Lepeophtheirus salmonis TaxID=72036 RepID=A0A0K2VAW7_LEPSM
MNTFDMNLQVSRLYKRTRGVIRLDFFLVLMNTFYIHLQVFRSFKRNRAHYNLIFIVTTNYLVC